MNIVGAFSSIGHVFAVGYRDFKNFVTGAESDMAAVGSIPGAQQAIESATGKIPVAGPVLVRIEEALMGNALAVMHAKQTGQPAPDILTPELESALLPLLGHISPQVGAALATVQVIGGVVQAVSAAHAGASAPAATTAAPASSAKPS